MKTLYRIKRLLGYFLRPRGSLLTSFLCALVVFQLLSLTGSFFDLFKVQFKENLRNSSWMVISDCSLPNGSCIEDKVLHKSIQTLQAISFLTTTIKKTEMINSSIKSRKSSKNTTYLKADNWKVIHILTGYYVFGYSAFYDDRVFPKVVRIHAIAPLRFTKTMRNTMCVVRMKDGRVVTTSNQVELQREHFSLPWASHFFYCQAENFDKGDAKDVTVVDPSYWNGSDMKIFDEKRSLKVNQIAANLSMKTLGVCVKPIHFHFDKSLWLVEFLEMYRIQGASHFYLYNHNLSKSVEKVLIHYIDKGLVTLLPWNLPIQSQKLIRTEAMFSAIEDCILRSVNLFRFLAIVDFDEYILPKNSPSLAKFVSDLSNLRPGLGSFVFRNVFHYLYWENDENYKSNSSRPFLLTQFKTRRVNNPSKRGLRSKYVVKPEAVALAGNHLVWRLLKGFSQFNVLDSDAMSHHYRICEFGGKTCTSLPSTVDRTAHKWSNELFKNVITECGEIFHDDQKCPDPPNIT